LNTPLESNSGEGEENVDPDSDLGTSDGEWENSMLALIGEFENHPLKNKIF
jgi:hypothetical protein